MCFFSWTSCALDITLNFEQLQYQELSIARISFISSLMVKPLFNFKLGKTHSKNWFLQELSVTFEMRVTCSHEASSHTCMSAYKEMEFKFAYGKIMSAYILPWLSFYGLLAPNVPCMANKSWKIGSAFPIQLNDLNSCKGSSHSISWMR